MYKIHFFAGELEGNVHYELVSETSNLTEASKIASTIEREGKKVIITHFGKIVYESDFSNIEEIDILRKRIPGPLHLLKETLLDIYNQIRTLCGKKPS